MRRTTTLAAALAGTLIGTGMTQAADINVLASNALKEAYLELVPGFEKATEHKVATTWAGTNDIKKRMAAGETYDLVIMAGPALDELVKQGKIVPGSRVDLAKSGVGRRAGDRQHQDLGPLGARGAAGQEERHP